MGIGKRIIDKVIRDFSWVLIWLVSLSDKEAAEGLAKEQEEIDNLSGKER